MWSFSISTQAPFGHPHSNWKEDGDEYRKDSICQLIDFLYLLVAIAKKKLKIDRSMGEILQILSIGLLEKTPFLQAFTRERTTISEEVHPNQLFLFNF